MSTTTNPALQFVNMLDEEDCEACAMNDNGNWPCAYHYGFRAGYSEAMERMQRLLDGIDD